MIVERETVFEMTRSSPNETDTRKEETLPFG